MLHYPNLISQLSDTDKIKILCDIRHLADKKYKVLGIPSIQIASIEDDSPVPSPATMSNTWNPALMASVADHRLREMAGQGVDVAIVPGPRPKIDPYRSALSEDPLLSATAAGSYVRAAARHGLNVCFDGLYLEETDLEWTDDPPDQRTLLEYWCKPYEEALAGETCAVMLTPATVNESSRTLIRAFAARMQGRECFFLCRRAEGNTVRYLLDGGICLFGAQAVLEAALARYRRLKQEIDAGTATVDELLRAQADGTAISPEALDEAADRLLRFVFRVKRKPSIAVLPLDGDAPRQAAYESVVLLKNDSALPLHPGAKLCLIGDIGLQARADGTAFLPQLSDFLAEMGFVTGPCLRGYDLNADRSEALAAPAISEAKKADAVLLFLGLGPTRAANSHRARRISIPANQLALLDLLSGAVSGKIIAVAPPECCPDLVATGRCAAVIYAPLETPHSAQALCDILCGRANPSGHLAATVYGESDSLYRRHWTARRREGLQSGCFIGYRYYASAGLTPGFPFGFGLSYTRFTCSQLTVSDNTAQLTVANTGKRAGATVVQIYVEKKDSALLRPKLELAGFARVELAAGQRRSVQISFSIPRFYDAPSDSFREEAGAYTLYAGFSVADLPLRQDITLEGASPEAEQKPLSHYLSSESNILADQFKLEAKYTTMKKSYSNFIIAGVAIVLAALLRTYCAAVELAGLFFDIFSLILAGVGVYLLIAELIYRDRLRKAQREQSEAHSTQVFEEADATHIPVFAAATVFAEEFDATQGPIDREEEATVEGVEPDQLAYVDAEQTFPAAVQELCTFAAERGCRISQDTARELFASLASSRLLILGDTDGPSLNKLMAVVAEYFETALYLERADESYTTTQRLFLTEEDDPTAVHTALTHAASAPHQIHFAVLDNVDPAQLAQYFTALIPYLRNPMGNISVRSANAQGAETAYRIPQNLWFVLNLAPEATPDQLPELFANAAAVCRFPFEACPAREQCSPVGKFSYYQLNYLTEKALNAASIPEDSWKKLDRLEQAARRDDEPLFDNRMWLRLEKYAHVYLTCEENIPAALDRAVCSGLLLRLMSALRAAPEKQSLSELLEQTLGDEGSSVCKKLIRACGTGRS